MAEAVVEFGSMSVVDDEASSSEEEEDDDDESEVEAEVEAPFEGGGAVAPARGR